MPGAEVRRYSSDRLGLARNLLLGVAGGAFTALAETLLLPIIVLSFFVGQLTMSYTLVGLVPAIGVGLWAVARVPAGLLNGSQRRKQPAAIAAALVKVVATALLAVLCFRVEPAALGANAEPLLRTFFLCWVVFSLASGFASVPTAGLIAKAIPDVRRALFYRQRALWGSLAGVLAGLVVAQLLRPGGPPFPRNYGLIFLAATVCQLAAVFFLSTLREPVRVAAVDGPSPLAIAQGAPAALRDANLRRFLLFRGLLSASAVVDPFLVFFALTRLGVSSAAVGGYVAAYVLGRLASVPVWSVLARTAGERASLQFAALLRLVPAPLALVLPYLGGFEPLSRPTAGDPLVGVLFGAAFFALGATGAAQGRSNFAYIAEIAPARLHGIYAGLTNALLAVVAFAPVLGGIIVAQRGYETLFLIASALGLLAVFASGALLDTFVPTRNAATAQRLRRAAPRPVGPAAPALPAERGRGDGA